MYCNFCNRTMPSTPTRKSDISIMSQNGDIVICADCITLAVDTINSVKIDSTGVNGTVLKAINPKSLKSKLDDWIIEQEKAKKILSVAIYDHYKRINEAKDTEEPIEKSNIILVGQTGSGKTAIVKALAKQLDIPLVIEDLTTMTAAGYTGSNVEDALVSLIAAANGDVELAQKGIVLLDEGDKIKRYGDGGSAQRDVKGESVQQGLLKITENGVYNVKYQHENVVFDTSNVLFILAGAFEGLEKIIDKRLKASNNNKKSSGFTGRVQSKTDIDYNKTILDVKPEDLQKFGLMPELLGRFPVIGALQELSEEALVTILTEPKGAIIKQVQKLFGMDNIELEITPGALSLIAKKAKERKTGARALRSIVEDILLEPKFELPGSDYKKVIVKDDLTLEYIKN